MAGHLAGVYVDRETQTGAAALTNSGTRGDMDMFAIAPGREGDRALARADRGVAAGGGAARGCARRCSAAGGRKGTSSSSGGRAARCRRRSQARAAGQGRDDVRARRRRLARRSRPRARRAAARRRRAARLGGLRVHARAGALQGASDSARAKRVGDDGDRAVDAGEHEALPAASSVRPSTTIAANDRRCGHRRDLDRAERQRQPAADDPREQATAGATKTATCIDDVIAISVASVVLPRCAITTAPPCSAALPTIATITTAMKNSFRPTAWPNVLERVHEDLRDERGRDRRGGEPADRLARATRRASLASARSAARWMRRLRTVITT